MTASTARNVLLPCLWAIPFLLALHVLALAQQRQGDVVGAVPTAREEAAAAPEVKTLANEPVTATITVLRTQKPFPVGGSVFARVELTNAGKSRNAEAHLQLDAETAQIIGVTGNGIDVSGDQQSRMVKVTRLAKGKASVLLVELALRQASPPDRNALKITLRSPAGTNQSARFDWDVIDCAGGFYSEIEKVREGSGSGIEQALQAARKHDASRPGRWLFSPRVAAAGKRGKCLASVKRWNRRRGRHVYVCTKYEEIASGASPSSVPYEGRVYRFASSLVTARATDRELAPTRDSGWATTRVSQNLKGFLSQEHHPAICTGTLRFFDYFDKRMDGFLKRAETYDDMAAKSYALALLRTVEAVEASQAEPGGHPGWGASPLFPLAGQSEISLRQMVETVAKIPGETGIGDAMPDTATNFDWLNALAQYMKSEEARSLSDSTRHALQSALGAIEAADYITTVAGQYADLRDALAGSMKTLRQAHSSRCTCNG